MPPLSDPELLARLVGFDTVSARSNLAMTDFLADYLAGPAAACERLLSADRRKANLLVRIGPERGDGSGLILCGHMDVVPPGEGWRSAPFTLARVDRRWLGRGTCDMKGFLAVAVNLAAGADGSRLRAPLVLLFTHDEEVGSLGARRFAAEWPPDRPLPRAVVVGEPTGLGVVRMHKGHLRLRLTLTGRSAHSAFPHLGVSAIEPAGPAIDALVALRRALASETVAAGEHFPETPYVTLNIGRIEGGSAVNVIPAACTLDLGLRTLPGVDAASLEDRVRRSLEEALPPGIWRLEGLGESPPFELREEAPVYRELCDLVGQRRTVGTAFSTDAGFLATMGLDCAVFGPGSIAVAHQPDEFVPEEDLVRCREVLSRLVDRRCGDGAPGPGPA